MEFKLCACVNARLEWSGIIWLLQLTRHWTVCSFSYFTAAFCCMETLPVIVVMMVTFVLWLVVCYFLSQRLLFLVCLYECCFFLFMFYSFFVDVFLEKHKRLHLYQMIDYIYKYIYHSPFCCVSFKLFPCFKNF